MLRLLPETSAESSIKQTLKKNKEKNFIVLIKTNLKVIWTLIGKNNLRQSLKVSKYKFCEVWTQSSRNIERIVLQKNFFVLSSFI